MQPHYTEPEPIFLAHPIIDPDARPTIEQAHAELVNAGIQFPVYTPEEQEYLRRCEIITQTAHILINFRRIPTPHTSEECYHFLGNIDNHGYPLIRYRRKQYKAHRLLWQRTHAIPIPHTLIMHRLCPERTCVNLSHYILTTRQYVRIGGQIDYTRLLYDDPL
jgi:hypothetical protein